jgi:hypothetical protein
MEEGAGRDQDWPARVEELLAYRRDGDGVQVRCIVGRIAERDGVVAGSQLHRMTMLAGELKLVPLRASSCAVPSCAKNPISANQR